MISFDWAIKRLLRNKANFVVLEGFLSELLRQKITITSIAESESNQQHENDKYNRVDILVENDKKELIIIELQFYGEDDYFQRMLYGVSKTITDNMSLGDSYEKIRKVYSINIVYFDLGTGNDYIYHGYTNFKGLHTNEDLELSDKQKGIYRNNYPGDFCPEYYIIKARNFNDVAKDTLDEWIYYIKNNKIRDDFTAQGLEQARSILAYDNLTDAEKKQYDKEIKNDRIRNSEIKTAFTDGEIKGRKEGREKGREEGRKEGEAIGEKKAAINFAIKLSQRGISEQEISEITGLTVQELSELLKNQ
jgi:predicted transposase/invertase (TIGR01784 family)